jgi:hypothetical protein
MTLAELLALIANLAAMTDEELATLDENLVAAAEERSAAASDTQLEELEQIQAAVEQVRTEAANRETAAADRAARAEAALQAIRDETTDPGDGEGDEGDGETPEGDGEESDTPEGETPEGEEPAPVEGETPAQIAASGAQRAPRISRVAARRPASMTPRREAHPAQTATLPELGLVASANLAGFTAGERIDDAEKLANAFWAGVQTTAGYRHGPRVKVPIARAGSERLEDLGFTPDRILDSNVRENARKISAVTSPNAVVAAGGVCAPMPVQYDLPVLAGSEARPVRDEMLTRFGADRGGVVTLPPPVLTDLDGAITIWDNDTDTTPGGSTKACLTVDCPAEDETLVQAIVQCLQFGNFRARFFAEQIEAWMRLAAVNHARRAENESLSTIGSGSTQVTHGQILGSIPDVLAGLDLASAGIRSRHRLGRMFPLRFGFPEWLLANMRTDEARRIPGTVTTDERYALAEAKILQWFAARNINPTIFLDGESGQVFGPQGDGPLVGWPSTVVTYLYPEGSWLFLDGGTLDLGIVRDSVLNGTNNFQMFSETFEATHFHGVESYRLTMDICPDGTVSGTSDIDPCSTGS